MFASEHHVLTSILRLRNDELSFVKHQDMTDKHILQMLVKNKVRCRYDEVSEELLRPREGGRGTRAPEFGRSHKTLVQSLVFLWMLLFEECEEAQV